MAIGLVYKLLKIIILETAQPLLGLLVFLAQLLGGRLRLMADV